MTTVEYDLDTSGGLMPQIQALIAPPISDETSKRGNRDSRYRRPGRAVNHDCCDSCTEGGDLICCDRCPAAFHLQCHDPPLAEEEVPTGEWLCRRCRVAPPQLQSEESTTVPPGGVAAQGKCGLEEIEEEVEEVVAPPPLLPPLVDSHNPFQMLISAAACVNPTQFQLETDLTCNIQLPGSSKRCRYKDGNKAGAKKPAHELDNAMVPLPAKLCFQCRKSCRKAPLVQCDYCPLLFHADCLDPPLTTLPTGRWMCPNHAEHILDEKLLSSVSLTERVKLWDRFSGHVNQDAVKVDFLKKIHRISPAFRYKIKLAPRTTVKVPNAIREQYKRPAQLLPRVTEVSSCAGQLGTLATPEEQEEWLSGLVSLQTGVVQYLAQRQLMDSKSNGDPDASELPKVKSETEKKQNNASSRIHQQGGTQKSGIALSSSPAILNLNSNLQTSIEGSGDIELSKLDERLIRILAFQRLQQLLPTKNNTSKQAVNGVYDALAVKARAVVCSSDGQGPTAPMPYRTLTIGTGADLDLCLANYGHCNFVSSKHACIFYDEITKHFELLNYSEHGTVVDNVLYSCDFSEKPLPPPPPHSLVATVRKMVDKARGRPEPPEIQRTTMSARAGDVRKGCNCKTSGSSLIGGSGAGWEGTALLHHGSYIKCGCLQFVFSITDYGECQTKTDDSNTAVQTP